MKTFFLLMCFCVCTAQTTNNDDSIPQIVSIKGCYDDGDTATKGCPTMGGATITITGENFAPDLNDIHVFVNSLICTELARDTDNINQLTCLLPKGTGLRVPVYVSTKQVLSAPVKLLSYDIPRVDNITGCDSTPKYPGMASECPRDGVLITITGENFGSMGASVLIGGVECTPVQHDPKNSNNRLTCQAPRPSGPSSIRTVVVMTESGAMSRKGSGRLSYIMCPQGSFHNPSRDYACDVCEQGRFSAKKGLTTCSKCNKGMYANHTGASNCQYCEVDTFAQFEGSTSCETCYAGTYSSTTGAWQCQRCDPGTYVHEYQCKKCPADAWCSEGLIQYNAASSTTGCLMGVIMISILLLF